MSESTFQNTCEKVLSELHGAVRQIRDEDAQLLIRQIRQARTIYLDGKGRSGFQAKAFAMRLAHMNLQAFETGGVTTTAIGSGDLLIICSGSGETENLVSHAKTARRTGAKVLLITTSAASTIGTMADDVIVFPGDDKVRETKISIQPMGTLFEQSLEIFFDTVVLLLMEELGVTEKSMHGRHNNLE